MTRIMLRLLNACVPDNRSLIINLKHFRSGFDFIKIIILFKNISSIRLSLFLTFLFNQNSKYSAEKYSVGMADTHAGISLAGPNFIGQWNAKWIGVCMYVCLIVYVNWLSRLSSAFVRVCVRKYMYKYTAYT